MRNDVSHSWCDRSDVPTVARFNLPHRSSQIVLSLPLWGASLAKRLSEGGPLSIQSLLSMVESPQESILWAEFNFVSDTEKSDERAYKIQVEIFHVLNQDYEFL